MIEYLDEFYERVRSGELILADCSEQITRNKDCCLEAIKYNSSNFLFVDKGLKQDKDCCLEAIKHNHLNFRFVDKGLKQDDKFIILALKVNPNVANELDTTTLNRILKKVIVRLNNVEKDVEKYKKHEEYRREQDNEEINRRFSKIVDEYGYDNPKEY